MRSKTSQRYISYNSLENQETVFYKNDKSIEIHRTSPIHIKILKISYIFRISHMFFFIGYITSNYGYIPQLWFLGYIYIYHILAIYSIKYGILEIYQLWLYIYISYTNLYHIFYTIAIGFPSEFPIDRPMNSPRSLATPSAVFGEILRQATDGDIVWQNGNIAALYIYICKI